MLGLLKKKIVSHHQTTNSKSLSAIHAELVETDYVELKEVKVKSYHLYSTRSDGTTLQWLCASQTGAGIS